MSFIHPLARSWRFRALNSMDGGEAELLEVVTSLELDPADERHRPDAVARLRAAARAYQRTRRPRAAGVMLVNPG